MHTHERFAALYQDTFKRIHRFFWYRDVPEPEIADLCQEVYMRYYARYGETDAEEEAAHKLLYGIAKNVWREWVRQESKHSHYALEEWDLPIEPQDEEFADDTELLEVLRRYIPKLSEALRPVIVARFLEGKTRAETAAKLGMSEKQVHVYQRRAVVSLQKIVLAASD
jgi:RNA polymerase sigma factor (sigma-70 family)